MTDLEHIARIEAGVDVWNEWRRQNPPAALHLSGAKLREKYLSSANLISAELDDADLFRSRLEYAVLCMADLRRADMRGTSIVRADLSDANLSGAELEGAVLGRTVFGGTNLSGVKNLDRCYHQFPSVIDFATIQKSWPLPLSFLRGCGLSDSLIDYLPSLLTPAIQFYSRFISHATRDQHFADRLHADLQNEGVRCWFAPHDVRAGRKLHEQIDEAIRLYDRLLLVLSEHSMESEWVKTEIASARQKERLEKRRVLFPIRLVPFEALRDWKCFDADTGKDSAREIREYFVPDFRNWKDHDSYQEAFERLLRDLRA